MARMKKKIKIRERGEMNEMMNKNIPEQKFTMSKVASLKNIRM